MPRSTTIRRSNRLSKASEPEGLNSSQSRITEFVNIRKRASSVTSNLKKIEEQNVREESLSALSTVSAISTPVKIKRKLSKPAILTPCPSMESVSEKPSIIEPTIAEVPKEEVKEPAYKRFAHLLSTVREQKAPEQLESISSAPIEQPLSNTLGLPLKTPVPWLPLNERWSLYEKIVFNVDNLCVLAAGRSQPCVYQKIQKTLENVIGKQVPVDQIERIKTLWPEAYDYREAKVIHQGKRVESVALSIPGIVETESSAALMIERKETIRARVQNYLIDSHNKSFGLEPQIIPRQWHEKFDQEGVQEILRTPLLFVEGQRSSTPIPKMIEQIIQTTPTFKKEVDGDNTMKNGVDNTTDNKANNTNNNKTLSLLERIRAKEQKLQALKCVSVDSESAKLEAILSQMERFTQSVMFTFTSAKKTSLFLTDLTGKLMQSSSIPLSQAEVLERLKFLERAAPDWIKIIDFAEGADGQSTLPKHVKILDKTRSLLSIMESLKQLKHHRQ